MQSSPPTLPIAFFILGAICLLIGLLGRIRIREGEANVSSKIWIRVILIILGFGSIGTSLLLFFREDTPVVERRNEALITIIKEQQGRYVRKSYGEAEGQCFSDAHLFEFNQQGTVGIITDKLRKNKRFHDAIVAMQTLPENEREDLFDRATSTYKKTWAEIGRIDPSGQTTAGQNAEKQIAEGIVELAKELLPLPEQEIRNG